MSCVHDQVDQRDAQPLGVGRHHAERGVEIEPHGGARRRLGGRGGLAAERVEVDGHGLEPNRAREVEHLVDDAIEPRDLLVDVGGGLAQRRRSDVGVPQRVQRRLDDHQRVAHFVRDDRGEPAERRQPFFLRDLPLKARHGVSQRVERRRHQARVLVVPSPPSKDDLAGEIAGGRDLTHGIRDGRQRPRNGPGHDEAEERGQQNGHDRSERQLPVDRSQKA